MSIRPLFAPFALGVLSFVCALNNAWAQQYTINPFAGDRTDGFAGDGGAATSAELDLPVGLAVDSSGNLYIADSDNNVIRKVSGGTITTIAGDGTGGYSGDTGAATKAELLYPAGVALDSSGNLYIADTGNHVIRMVSTSGTITTIAGTNTGGYSGDGGPAVNAELDFPTSVAVDRGGNVYIADSGNHVIREIAGGNIQTVVGGATGQILNDPESVVVDSSGNLYISDQSGYRIWKYSNGVLSTIAGNGYAGFSGDNGPGVDASLDQPSAIALDSQGYLYICDTDNSVIRKLAPDGTVTTIAGIPQQFGYYGDGGPATQALLNFPRGIAVDSSGNVYVSDNINYIVRWMQPTAPAINVGGIVNAAGYTAQVSPGALASIFGANFTGIGTSAIAPSLPLPNDLGLVTVSVNGINAPVLYAGSGQINFQIPWETPPGSAKIIVSAAGIVSGTATVNVLPAAPGLFFQGSHAIVQNSDYSLNSSNNPAKAGSTIITYLTGAGPVSNQPADGEAAGSSPLSAVSSTVTATIGGQPAQVSSADLAPDFVGLWQVNIVVPSGVATGDQPLVVTVGGQSSNSANVSVTP